MEGTVLRALRLPGLHCSSKSNTRCRVVIKTRHLYCFSYLPKMGTVDEPSEKGEMMLRCRRQLEASTERRETLDQIKRTSMWRRAVGYPLIMVALFALTFVSLVSVINNVMQIVAGFKALPAVSEVRRPFKFNLNNTLPVLDKPPSGSSTHYIFRVFFFYRTLRTHWVSRH